MTRRSLPGKKVQTDGAVSLQFDDVRAQIDALSDNPLVRQGGSHVTDVRCGALPFRVDHRLGRKPIGVLVTRSAGAPIAIQVAQWDEKTATLIASAGGQADLLFF